MKKFISALLAFALLLSAPVVTAEAAKDDVVTYYAEEAYFENCFDPVQMGGKYGYYHDLYGTIGLKPASYDSGATPVYDHSAPARVIFDVEAEVAGRYVLGVVYSTEKDSRYFAYSVNGSSPINVQGTVCAGASNDEKWNASNANTYSVYVMLEKGSNEIVLQTPNDYDNNKEGRNICSVNIWAITLELKSATATEDEEPAVAPTPTQAAPTPTQAAPTPTQAAPAEDEKPVVTPTKPASKPIEVTGEEYTIQKGDTLGKIAKACGLTVKELAEANNIENPNRIRAGKVLIIPDLSDVRVIVKKGDTLGKIAKANGCTIKELVAANGIENPNLIFVGQAIKLPQK